MQVPLRKEISDKLSELELAQIHTDIESGIHKSSGGARVRSTLLFHESRNSPKRITKSSFWGVSEKYRFDMLAGDIGNIATGMALSLALSHIYLPFAPQPNARALISNVGGSLFWYHMESGFRLASSGWDRISLLIDLAFNLQLREKAKLKTVLQKLPKEYDTLVANPHFKWLKTFRDGAFSDLEGELLGVRHEATHRVSLSIRFHHEYLENFGLWQEGQIRAPNELHAMLLAHYNYYIEGVTEMVALLDSAPTENIE